ncbi:arginine rich protein [Apiospora arundinis]
MAASTEQTPAAATLTSPSAARKFKASDLPLTSATRSAIEGLAHSFKKKGGYDAIRKQVWEQFEASDYEKQVTKSILEVAEKEVERNPSQLLSLDRRKAAALIDGALDRSGVYQKAEEVIDQLIDAKAIEERIRDLRKAEIGEEAALAEQQRGAKTDQDYAEDASQRLAEREKLRRELKEKEEQIQEEKRKIEREERKKQERELEKIEAKRIEEREARRLEREAKEAEREKQRQKERDERRAAREKEREERDKERDKEREARRQERTRENADRDKDRDREREKARDRPREKSRDRSRHRDRDRRDRSRSPRRRDSRERRRRDSSRTARDTKDRRRPEEPKKQLSKEELERIERDALADLLRESNGNPEKAPEVEIDEALAPPPRRVKPASAIQPLRRDSPKTAVEGKKASELVKADSKDSVHPTKDAAQMPTEAKDVKEVKKEIKIDIKGLKEPLAAKDSRSHSDSKEVKLSQDVKVSKATDDRRGSTATSTRDKDHARTRADDDDRRRDRPRERSRSHARPERRDRERSRSRDRRDRREPSRTRERFPFENNYRPGEIRNRSRNRSRSRSRRRTERERERSKPRRERSRSRDRTKAKERSRSRAREDRDKPREPSRSKTRTERRERSRSPRPRTERKDRSRSRVRTDRRERSRSVKRDRSRDNKDHERSRTIGEPRRRSRNARRSRSRSRPGGSSNKVYEVQLTDAEAWKENEIKRREQEAKAYLAAQREAREKGLPVPGLDERRSTAASRRKLIATALPIASVIETEATGIDQWTASAVKRTATGNETAAESPVVMIGGIGIGTETMRLGQRGDGADLEVAAGTAIEAGTDATETVMKRTHHAVAAGTGARSRLAETLRHGEPEVAIRCETADALEARVRRRALRRTLLPVVVTSFDPLGADPPECINSVSVIVLSPGVFVFS